MGALEICHEEQERLKRKIVKLLEQTKQLQAENEKKHQEGFIAGLREYAWWKDGIQYVGSCGTTLKKAIEQALKVKDDKNPAGESR